MFGFFTSGYIGALVDVMNDDAKLDLGTDNISLSFDFSYWTAMESVADDVDIYVEWRY